MAILTLILRGARSKYRAQGVDINGAEDSKRGSQFAVVADVAVCGMMPNTGECAEKPSEDPLSYWIVCFFGFPPCFRDPVIGVCLS